MFHIIALENCPYSERCAQMFKNELKNAPHKITWVNSNNKHHYKTSPERMTFPQITFKTKNKKGTQDIFIGGSEDLQHLVNMSEQWKKNKTNVYCILPFMTLLQQ
jgi:heptaprenylglyceryl phosphate synthase